MSKTIRILPDMGDESPVVELAAHLFDGHKRAFYGYFGDDTSSTELTEVAAALVIDGLDGDWSAVPGFAKGAETHAKTHKRAGTDNPPPYAPAWPDFLSAARRSKVLGARLSVVRRLSDEVVAEAANEAMRLMGLAEDEKGNSDGR